MDAPSAPRLPRDCPAPIFGQIDVNRRQPLHGLVRACAISAFRLSRKRQAKGHGKAKPKRRKTYSAFYNSADQAAGIGPGLAAHGVHCGKRDLRQTAAGKTHRQGRFARFPAGCKLFGNHTHRL